MSYSSPSAVGAYCRSLLGEFTTWTESSCPTIQQVKGWLSTGCSIIEARLSGAGYSVPVGKSAGAYDWISDLNALFAAARAEMSRSNVTLGPGERTRGQVFEEMFWKGIDDLTEHDLTSLGVDRASRGQMYAGGISYGDKQSYESDSNRVVPRFGREQFRFPGVSDPVPTSGSPV